MSENSGLTRKDACEYLFKKYGAAGKVSPITLRTLASTGGGPVYRKVGKFCFYREIDLDAWMASRTSGTVRKASEIQQAMPV